jgi:hypothetical protein
MLHSLPAGLHESVLPCERARVASIYCLDSWVLYHSQNKPLKPGKCATERLSVQLVHTAGGA